MEKKNTCGTQRLIILFAHRACHRIHNSWSCLQKCFWLVSRHLHIKLWENFVKSVYETVFLFGWWPASFADTCLGPSCNLRKRTAWRAWRASVQEASWRATHFSFILSIPDGYMNTYCWYLRILQQSFVVDGMSSHAAAARRESSYISIVNKADRVVKVNIYFSLYY